MKFKTHPLYLNAWHTKVADLTPAQMRRLKRWLKDLWGQYAHMEQLDAQDMQTATGLVMQQHYTKAYSEV